MGSREQGDTSQSERFIEDQDGPQDDTNHYSNRVHSLHRNKAFKTHDHLIKGHEARIGGTGVRTLGRHINAECFKDVIEEHADLIVSKMEQDPALIEDSPASNDLRREALRDMPQCLTLKRCVKQKLQKSIDRKAKRKPISCWKMMNYRVSFFFSKLAYETKSLLYFFELWYSSLKKIEGSFGSGVGSFFKFLRTIFLLNFLIAVVSLVFIVVPQFLYENEKNITSPTGLYWSDVFTGTGFFTNTPLFYGFYTNHTINFLFMPYNMPHAYFFTMVGIFLIFLVFFSMSAAVAYRQSFIETEGGLKNVFAQKIFCGWDFSIATREAAHLRSQAIYHDLKELLFETLKLKIESSCLETFCLRTKQVVMNVLITCGIIGIGYATDFFLDQASATDFFPVVCAVFVNVMMTVIPFLLSWIIRFENYKSPKTSLYWTLIRIFMLGFAIIGVLFSYWLQNPNQKCWGTKLGQEIYRLIIFDFIISVIFTPILDYGIYSVARCFDEKRHLNFDISRNIMHIIYNQILLWLGILFSPLLPVVMAIKFFIIWYVRQMILMKCCKPSSKSWRATQTITWFLMITFVGLLFVIGLMGYIVSAIPNTDCGPFKHYNYIYEIVTVDMLHLKNNSDIFKIVLLVTKPGFIALILVGLGALIYYLRAKADAQRKLVAAYRKMLVWEAKDKKFLIHNIAHITKGKWQYRLQDGRKQDPLLTSPFIMRHETDEEVRGLISYGDLSSPSTSAVNRRSADMGIEIANDCFEDYKKIS